MTCATNILGLEERRAAGLRYFAGGDGEPVVLVHGLAGSAANWVELLPALAERYRVLAVDLPGHGGSAPPPPGASVTDFADAVAGVIELERVGPALLAGHSFGGLV